MFQKTKFWVKKMFECDVDKSVCSPTVRIIAFQAIDPGSTPGRRINFLFVKGLIFLLARVYLLWEKLVFLLLYQWRDHVLIFLGFMSWDLLHGAKQRFSKGLSRLMTCLLFIWDLWIVSTVLSSYLWIKNLSSTKNIWTI